MQRRYRRYFIMLEIDDPGFGISKNQGPKGYGKIEIKNQQGTLWINCQGFRPDQKEYRYRWYFINTKKEEEPAIVEVGPMEIDEKGKGELVWEFNPENVRGSMEEIDHFNVLVLAAQNKEDRNQLLVPLVGYIDKEKDPSWRYALERYLYITPKRREALLKEKPVEAREGALDQEPIKQDQEPIKQDQGPRNQEGLEESTKEPIEEKEKSRLVLIGEEAEKIGEAKGPCQEATIPPREGVQEERSPVDPRSSQEEVTESLHPNLELKEDRQQENTGGEGEEGSHREGEEALLEGEDPREDDYAVQLQSYVENALKDFLAVDPHMAGLEGYHWWQIPYNYQTMYRSYMPFISYLDFALEPANYFGSKVPQGLYLYQHHLFGICYGKDGLAQYYCYGIPGRDLPMEKPYEEAYWQPSGHWLQSTYVPGYWILIIDGKTGKTVNNIQF